MPTRAWWLLLVLSGCGAALRTVPAEEVAKTERSAREVELCLIESERFDRPMYQAVQELSFAPWPFTLATVVMKHPAGLTVLDPGVGSSIAEDLRRAPLYFQMVLGALGTKTPLVAGLAAAGISPSDVKYALVTHVHWDHVGALRDLPAAKVLISKPELEWARHLHRFVEAGVMPHHLAGAKARLFEFDFNGPPVDGFEKSFDVFGDGSVVAVPMPGHTPGSAAYLVRSKGLTWLFIGDTAWALRGVELQEQKTVPIDDDRDAVAQQLSRLNAFLRHRSDVVVVPAHDAQTLERLPFCTKE